MLCSTILVLLIIVVDLYRPIIIGNAIDTYLTEANVGHMEVYGGLLQSAGLYLIMLLAGFVLNAVNNWIL